MKFKILSVVTIIIAVLWSTNVFAASYNGYIYEAEKIPDIYYYKHREDTETEKYEYHNFHSQAAVNRRSSDNKLVYCIESWQSLTGANKGDYKEEREPSLTKLSVEQIDRIKKLAYFGYGYQDKNYNHLDIKWYAITQYLIWLTQAPNIEHYFVSSITSTTPLNVFEDEINELNSLVDSIPKMRIDHSELIMLGSSKTVKIDNLSSYEITYSDSLSIKTDLKKNTLEITPLSNKEGNITLKRKYNRIGEEHRYYLSDKHQNAMSIGDLDDEVVKYIILPSTATIEISAFEENKMTNEITPINGYMYGLFAKEDIYINGKKVRSKDDALQSNTTKNGVVKFVGVSVGKYYIKELFYMGDYYDNNKIVDVNVKDSNTIKEELYYHRQKLKINLKKYLTSPIIKDEKIYYSLITKSGIKFGLYNEDNELIANTETTSSGDIEFDLLIPYGNYYIKEISTFDNYYLSDFILPIAFERKGNTEYQIIENNYEVINYHKEGKLVVTKRDDKTKKPLSNVKFAIYNENNEIIKKLITDNKGEITITLPYGNYYLKELSTLDNYELDSTLVPFSITDTIQKLERTNKMLEIKEKPIESEILPPNLEYPKVEVELPKTDDNSFIDTILYLISSVCLILYRYVKKITI